MKATEAGIALIDTIKVDLLKSAKLTGIWENRLRKIEKGEYEASEFIAELKQQISQIVYDVLSDNSGYKIEVADVSKKQKEEKPKRKPAIRKFEQIVCPKCENGHVIKGRTAFGCSEFRKGCDFRVGFEELKSGEGTTPSALNKYIEKKYKKDGKI